MKVVLVIASLLNAALITSLLIAMIAIGGNLGLSSLSGIFIATGKPVASVLLFFLPSLGEYHEKALTFLIACLQLFVVVTAICCWFLSPRILSRQPQLEMTSPLLHK